MTRQEAIITPAVMRWARESARLSPEDASKRIGLPVEDLEAWEKGEKYPSMAQARKASEAYKRSLAIFYLPEPPKDFEPLKDFRQLPDAQRRDYSPELALLIRQLQSRQEWLRDYLISQGGPPLSFVGSASIEDSPVELARSIRRALGATIDEQCSTQGLPGALNYWVGMVEHLGACVCREGRIELDEARGIALSDSHAPFVYVNVNDSYAGRQFTLMHELVHLWINAPGLSNLVNVPKSPRSADAKIEAFCNRTAALALVPTEEFATAWRQRNPRQPVDEQIEAVAKKFRVSEETIARRLLDGNVIDQPEYERLRARYSTRWREHKDRASGGGTYYWNTLARNGRLFTVTVLSACYSGEITIRDACLALGVKANNLSKLAETAGMMPTAQHGGGR
jgi:Zn-dependent peptidase ImmA (M78 family)